MNGEPETLPYRPCVGIMLFNEAGQVFVARRIDMVSEAWQMPQGGIDPGEAPDTAAFRELGEEIGTSNAEILDRTEDWLTYDLPLELIGKIWGGRYRGQRQLWFAMRFLGSDSDIDIETEKPEFLEWKWVEPDQLPDLIVPFKRALYAELVARFGHLAERVRRQPD
jgi:putative (di)nucleoside polyphosphate hydrolase